MADSIIVALITGGMALITGIASSIITANRTNREFNSKLEIQNAVMNTKMEQLTEEVRKHNNLVERTFRLEQHNEVQDEKISVANHRIEDLENRIEKYHG